MVEGRRKDQMGKPGKPDVDCRTASGPARLGIRCSAISQWEPKGHETLLAEKPSWVALNSNHLQHLLSYLVEPNR